MTQRLLATNIFTGTDRGVVARAAVHHDGGLITDIAADAGEISANTLVIPALINAHDHARPSMTSFGASGMPLETWIARSAFGTPPDPYLAAAVSLARSVRAGCGGAMIHYTRPSGTMPIVEEAIAIARAAGDVGVRLAFALAVRDQNPIVYGDETDVLLSLPAADRSTIEKMFVRPAMPPADYIAQVEAIDAAIAGPMVDVQFGPAGVQWCSQPLLEAIAERSAETGRRVHMHLLETIYQRAWADRAFPGGMVRYLKEIGLLSPRLTLAHCIHARPDELDLIAESGATIVTNFSSNLHLRSGRAPIADAHRRGCPVTFGIDGVALDEDDDAIREMRLVRMAHDGQGFERTWSNEEFLALAVRNGRRAIGAPGSGALQAGAPADFTVLDIGQLDRDAIMPVDPLTMLFARGNASCVRDVVVNGRTISRDGKPTGVDLDAMEIELRAMYRSNVPRYRELEHAWKPFERAVSQWFCTQGCC
ncbi:amidohydrolase family protein [Tardiphaga sp.]|uniref:amidohydrolase family protein n=1 Tax=Tardiphaga sp. TaxID=1926292 RepID=UPI00261F4EE1|nr:amidohydrolase family protein [Tardiphaga sp.]MDB5620260.1 amidohydrolase [Tardiphaga sp.]